MRDYESYSLEGANFRICSSKNDSIKSEIQKQRKILIAYIKKHPEFMDALEPLPILENAPDIVQRMHNASQKVGVGPMASVAGITAQFAAEAALQNGSEEAIVENGGDIYIASKADVVIGIYAGNSPLSGKLAFHIKPEQMPLSICSSSSKMGHSLSFGNCDLATVIAKDAALADAAATHACNLVKKVSDINPTLEFIAGISGISGALIIKDDQIGLIGNLPEIVKFRDADFTEKITIDPNSNEKLS